MITMREYWEERIRGQVMAMLKGGELPAPVHNNLRDFGKAIDTCLTSLHDYPQGRDERETNTQMVVQTKELIRRLGIFLDQSIKPSADALIWTADSKKAAFSMMREIIRCSNALISQNWWPAAATIRYADPCQNQAEVVGCAPFFKEELFYEGIEYDDRGSPVEPVPPHQTMLYLCGYLDHQVDGEIDIIITQFVGLSSTEDVSCQGVESMVRSERIAGIGPELAWTREVQRTQARSKSRIKETIDAARAELMMLPPGVH
jgi:hypothetical protein